MDGDEEVEWSYFIHAGEQMLQVCLGEASFWDAAFWPRWEMVGRKWPFGQGGHPLTRGRLSYLHG